MIDERNNHIAEKQKTLAGAAVGYIGKLRWANPKLFCQNLPVALGLVQHVDEIRVFKNILDFTGSQQILHILRQAAGNPAPFSEPLPDLNGKSTGLAFEQEMEFINIEPGRFMLLPVGGDAVPQRPA